MPPGCSEIATGHAHLQRELLNRGLLAGDAGERRAERFHVLRQALGRVALGIDRHEHDVRALFGRQIGELLLDLRQQRKRRRAHVRAGGEAKEQNAPVTAQLLQSERLTVLIDERHGRQRPGGSSSVALAKVGPPERSSSARDNSMPAAIATIATTAASPIDFARLICLLVARSIACPPRNPLPGSPPRNCVPSPDDRPRARPGAPEPATVAQLISFAAERFAHAELWFGHGTDNAVDEAAELVFFAAGLRHDEAEEVYGQTLKAAQRTKALGLIERRIRERVPAAYLTHRMWFAGHEFYVDDRVLVPRSPIAELIHAHFRPWIDPAKVRRVLDIGTGSGCIAIASALAFPKAKVDAADLSPDALAVTRKNIERHGVRERVRAVKSDVFDGLKDERYDVIVSNPPVCGR